MPQCVHFPFNIRTYKIGFNLFLFAPIVILTRYHMKRPKIILIFLTSNIKYTVRGTCNSGDPVRARRTAPQE